VVSLSMWPFDRGRNAPELLSTIEPVHVTLAKVNLKVTP
jgi:hypothetical protein